jgi:ureidoacrylate peracid hydrolase
MTLREHLVPATTALVLIDVQNDFCHPEGATARSGKSVEAAAGMMAPLQRLLARARGAGVHVIFVQMLQTPWTVTKTYLYKGGDQRRADKCLAGTWGAEFYGVAPLDGEPVVTKHRYSAFVGTSLETILHALGVSTLVMTGVATNVCVESTARDAFMRDYDVVVVSDCTATSNPTAHEGTLANIRDYFGRVASSEEIVTAWSAQRETASA